LPFSFVLGFCVSSQAAVFGLASDKTLVFIRFRLGAAENPRKFSELFVSDTDSANPGCRSAPTRGLKCIYQFPAAYALGSVIRLRGRQNVTLEDGVLSLTSRRTNGKYRSFSPAGNGSIWMVFENLALALPDCL
jgi:hypothetical protein